MIRLALIPLLFAFTLAPVPAADPPSPTATEQKLLDKLTELKGEAKIDPELDSAARVAVVFEKATDKMLLAIYKDDLIGAVEVRDTKLLTLTGFSCFKAMKNLQKLVLAGGGMSYTEAVKLSECPRLTTLYVGGMKMSDDNIIGLKGLTKLKVLDLMDAPVTDKSVDTILKFADLEELNLSGTKVTDTGMKKLLALNKLKLVQLNNSKVSREGVDTVTATLQKDKRDLIVRW